MSLARAHSQYMFPAGAETDPVIVTVTLGLPAVSPVREVTELIYSGLLVICARSTCVEAVGHIACPLTSSVVASAKIGGELLSLAGVVQGSANVPPLSARAVPTDATITEDRSVVACNSTMTALSGGNPLPANTSPS
jgi:hypothetical protein